MLVNDYYPIDNPASDTHKPSLAFDGNPETFIHSWGASPSGINIYFGGTYSISTITFQPRYNHYLNNNENTNFVTINQSGGEENCGTLTGTDTGTNTVAAQTYKIPCENKQGVGLKVWKNIGSRWCPAEIQISYSNREC